MARRPGLNKTVIVQAAAELADRIGLDKLTFSAIAEHFGVRTPSLYNHIEGLDGLRRELSLLGMFELNHCLQRAALGKARDEALRSMLHAYRAFSKQRPGLYETTLQAPVPNDLQLKSASQQIIDTVQVVLQPYKLGHDEGIHVIRGFRAIGHGFATLELAGAFGLSTDTDESYELLISAFLEGLNQLAEQQNQT